MHPLTLDKWSYFVESRKLNIVNARRDSTFHCSLSTNIADLADHLTVGCNHGPAPEIFVGEPHNS
jgi:hypothetical protein